jgi:hypothetical protein
MPGLYSMRGFRSPLLWKDFPLDTQGHVYGICALRATPEGETCLFAIDKM